MKTLTRGIFCVIFCATLAAQPDTLTILHVNDTHSNLMPLAPRNPDLSGQRGGIARVASFVGYTRMTEPNVLFLHAGDISIGDPMYAYYFGVPEYAILSQLGLDAMALGNHEFDLTPDGLQGSLDAATAEGLSFPLLSANTILDDPSVSALASYIIPHTVKTFGEVKVGIFGMTTPATMLLSLPGAALVSDDLGVIAATQVATLAAESCDVVIMLSHLGHYYDRVIAENVPGIHVIVGGHDHKLIQEPDGVVNPYGDTTWIVQAGAFYEYVGKLRLEVDGATVSVVDYSVVPMADAYAPEEPQIKAIVDALAADQETYYQAPLFSQPVWYADKTYEELATDVATAHETKTDMADLITQAYAYSVDCDLALTVGGATAQPIYAGPVTAADAFRAIGYGFNTEDGLGYYLTRFRISGADLIKGMEWGLADLDSNGDEFVVMGHLLRYTYDTSLPPGNRIDSVWVNGSPIDTHRLYSVVANQLILEFMKGYLQSEIGVEILEDTVLDRTELSVLLGLFTTLDVDEASATLPVPAEYSLGQNYPNPFNPTTSIRFTLPDAGLVRLEVFDVLGRRVESLVRATLEAGTHSVTWRAECASGVYFYRLEVMNSAGQKIFGQVRRMVLLR